MKASDCKPGDHLWSEYIYDQHVLEVVVLPPIETIYQDFVWCDFVDCPPGWRSPRHIRASNLHRTKEEVLQTYINSCNKQLEECTRKIERLREQITVINHRKAGYIKQLEEKK